MCALTMCGLTMKGEQACDQLTRSRLLSVVVTKSIEQYHTVLVTPQAQHQMLMAEVSGVE